jgi:hypothetical protein
MQTKALRVLLIVLGLFILSILIVVGPWPAYSSTDIEHAPYYVAALQRIDDAVDGQANGNEPGPLRAGWGRAVITPPLGTPLAGFGARKGRPSTGVHDQLFVKALLLSDGDSYAAIIGADMLIVPENVADMARARDAAVDPFLDYLRVQQADGDEAYVVRYSAHPTVLGASNVAFSADFPGYLQRRIEDEVGGFAMYLAGAVGSMAARAPDGADGFEQAQALGYALADRVLEASKDVEFASAVAVRAVGVPITPPPFQLRISKGWRLSPLLLPLAGVDHEGWLGAVRVGKVILVGAPGDLSGEISVDWRAWGKEHGVEVWPLSFNADYVGYISPDAYYATGPWEGDGGSAYERGLMSWCSPNQGAYFSGLMKHMVTTLYSPGSS